MRSKKVVYNIFFSLLNQLIIVLYGFIVPKIIISNFGSDVNGLVSSISQFLGYIVLLEAGFGPVVKAALYKPIAQKNKQEIANILGTSKRFFGNISKIFILYIIVLMFVYPLIINGQFDRLFTISLILIISISTFAEYFFGMTYKLYMQSSQENYAVSIIQISTYILCIVLVIISVKLYPSIHIIKLITALVFSLRPVLQNIYVKRKYQIDLKTADKNYVMSKKWDGLTQHIAFVIHNNTDVTVLTIFTKLSEVSVYSVYLMVVRGIKSIVSSFASGIDDLFGNMLVNDEHDNMSIKFSMYETVYFMIVTLFYTVTMILIVPFISIYTKDIFDVNYIRPTFGYLIVISEYIWAIRLPYSSVTYAAGHFKETKKGAIFEALSNIMISILLVIKYGIIGVAIGTIFAMTVRTIEFVYHTNKYILKQSIWPSFRKICLIIIETISIIYIVKIIPFNQCNNYYSWILNATVVFIIAFGYILIINLIFYRKELKQLVKVIKGVFLRKKGNVTKK